MANIVKLNHTASEIDDRLDKAGNAVLYTEQILTEVQKAQVRKNIGAKAEIETEIEVLDIVPAKSYPDITTFVYTEKESVGTSSVEYVVVKQGEIKGGLLSVNFDVETIVNFNFNIYLFDADGNPYKHSYGDTGVFEGELFEPIYADPGTGGGFGRVAAPFTMQLPDGCTFIACLRLTGTPTSANGAISSSADFANWAINGGITFIVTKETAESFDDNIIPLTAAINSNVKSINHRGYKTAPENTLSAYRLSKAKGFDIVECDITLTSDGIAVLLHDDTIDRTSNGTGTITDMTLEEVRAYDFGSWRGVEYAGEQIPTFEEFIALCRNIGLHPYIEVKPSGGFTQDDVDTLVDTVKKYGMHGKVTWISSGSAELQLIKTADPTARLGFVSGSSVEPWVINVIKSLKSDTNEVFIDAYYTITAESVTTCLSENIPLEVWGATSTEHIIDSNHYISGFTTDDIIAGVVLYDCYK